MAHANAAITTSDPFEGHVNQPSLYTCTSSYVKVTLNGIHTCWFLLDDGLEINMMPRCTFERLNYSIDTDIQWHVHTYESQKDEQRSIFEVCHRLPVDVKEVKVHTHVFVVENCEQNLIFRRLWERMAQASKVNDDEGHVMYKIKVQTGRGLLNLSESRPIMRKTDTIYACHNWERIMARWTL